VTLPESEAVVESGRPPMKGRSMGVRAPKRQRRRSRERKLSTDLAPQPDAVLYLGTTYETNVAQYLIETGLSPNRSDVLDSECSLPAKTRAGSSD
jgi:hypothetical protein